MSDNLIDGAGPSLDAFETLAKTRRSVRDFLPDPIPDALLWRLLDIARWAPSGYNLQPTRFVVVTDAALCERLLPACMDQRQITQAPAVVVFAGDRDVFATNFERVVRMELQNGSISPEYEAKLREFVPLAFSTGPAGLGWLWKATIAPIARLFRPIPSMPAVHRSAWLIKQVSLSAMVFMLAAHAAGLATVPMEGFDEGRLKRVLGLPRSLIVPMIVPVGYAAPHRLSKTRLGVDALVGMRGGEVINSLEWIPK
ncbi:MAG: nitroreductase family protein [Phycisphaerales bacterium]|nr:nitroreductase family protein [Phycisphaerales bacterium]